MRWGSVSGNVGTVQGTRQEKKIIIIFLFLFFKIKIKIYFFKFLNLFLFLYLYYTGRSNDLFVTFQFVRSVLHKCN